MAREGDRIDQLVDQYLSDGLDRREFFKRASALGLSLGFAGTLLAGLDRGSVAHAATRRSAAVVGGTLREGYDRDVSRMDPVNTTWWDPGLYPATHETLVATSPKGQFQPMLAKSWAVSKNGLEWMFTLRKGLKFQSGAVVTAAAVAAAMKTFADPKSGVNAGFWKPVKSIKAVGADKVKVTLSHPYADFPFVLNNGYSAIFNAPTRTKLGDKYGVTRTDGTGPFQLKELVPGSHAAVTRWDGYPGPGSPFVKNKGKAYLDGIRWEVLLEPAKRANELEAGNVDTLRNPAPQDVLRLKRNKNISVIELREPSLYLLGLNFKQTKLGFDDVRVRQAISYAIDRNAIVKTVFFGKATPAYTLVPSSYPYYVKAVEKYGAFDTAKANQLLDAAGWNRSGGGVRSKNGQKLSFKIIIENDKFEQLIAQAVQQMLKDVGVDMQFTVLGSDYFSKFAAPGGPTGYMIKNLWTNMMDASILFAGSANAVPACCNASNASIPALDKAFDDWQKAANVGQLRGAAARAQLITAQQLPFIPIVTPFVIWAHSKKVVGWVPNEANLYPYYNDVYLQK
ncbi:ABC-type dipeptide transport system periplasmic component [Gaiella occulta]|uniref:ABC-type dipeptide transport system periplasmic component n=1 Tax=Gaiella occulta TaxID=1002870 RepID=A0A7M2YU61_9ACTN|nr:ABC transporter substrate-binding protein [Gaiella occulta]RDI73623.1 ABC-type dipeptide transport system periplasmic component [Gaiella occulta]